VVDRSPSIAGRPDVAAVGRSVVVGEGGGEFLHIPPWHFPPKKFPKIKPTSFRAQPPRVRLAAPSASPSPRGSRGGPRFGTGGGSTAARGGAGHRPVGLAARRASAKAKTAKSRRAPRSWACRFGEPRVLFYFSHTKSCFYFLKFPTTPHLGANTPRQCRRIYEEGEFITHPSSLKCCQDIWDNLPCLWLVRPPQRGLVAPSAPLS
jgi:hypothetical protein